MGKNSYIGGNTIIYIPDSRKILLKKIHKKVSNSLDKKIYFSSIIKVFLEYTEYELQQVERELSSVYKEKKEFWINIINKSIPKNKTLFDSNSINSIGVILEKENKDKKSKVKSKYTKDSDITLLETQIELLKQKIQKNDWNQSLKRQLKDKIKILSAVKNK